MAEGLVIGAPRSGSGKTLVTLGLLGALRAAGHRVAAAKAGPDYIDTAFLTRAAGRPAINLDCWAMSPERLRALAGAQAAEAGLLVVEGAMGLFDGGADGRGSTGDLAAALGLPVILVADADGQGQSIAALVHGFSRWRADVRVAGVIVNRCGSMRHERLLAEALRATGVPVLGVVPKRETLAAPSRHLGLVLPAALEGADALLAAAAETVAAYVDIDRLRRLAAPVGTADAGAPGLPPLGQRIAVASDAAFAFAYGHWLKDWRAAGASLCPFSPLADEAPDAAADAVFLPGGYPELHAAALAAAERFKAGLASAARRGALIYGECGGYMALGETLTDAKGAVHAMAGLLPVATSIGAPRRVLGYRHLLHDSPLPWPARLAGHEFHYSRETRRQGAPPLFAASDARGEALSPPGMRIGRVMGSYAHVIDVA